MNDTITSRLNDVTNLLVVLKVYSKLSNRDLDNYGAYENNLIMLNMYYKQYSKITHKKTSASSKIKVKSMFKYKGLDCINIISKKWHWKMYIYYRKNSNSKWGNPLKKWTDLKAQKYRICPLYYTGKKGQYRILIRQEKGTAETPQEAF